MVSRRANPARRPMVVTGPWVCWLVRVDSPLSGGNDGALLYHRVIGLAPPVSTSLITGPLVAARWSEG